MGDGRDIEFNKMYIEWLSQNIEQYRINENIFRITMPFLDVSNDMVELYIIDNKDGSYVITDDGCTISNLKLLGVDCFSSSKRNNIFKSILLAHGVTKTNEDELIIKCMLGDLPSKKHMLAQCIVKVSDMFYLSKSSVSSIFFDDVQKYLDDNDVRYNKNISILGKSRLVNNFDFSIGKSKQSSERFIRVVGNMSLESARSIIFAWNDIKDQREKDAKLYAFIDNINRKVPQDAIGALEQYGIEPALWTDKNKYVNQLIA